MRKLATLAIAAAATLVGSAAFATSVTAFDTNFNSGAPTEFSGVNGDIRTEGVQGYAGVGTGPNLFGGDFLRNITVNPIEKTTLELTGLLPHTSIELNFLLAIIDSWDGIGCSSAGVSPDLFNVTVDGVSVFSEVFENACPVQTYVPPVGVELLRKVKLGFREIYSDSAYDMGLDPTFDAIPHTSSTLTIEWFASGSGWQGANDESWAIDNVEVILNLGPSCDIQMSQPVYRLGQTVIANSVRVVNSGNSQRAEIKSWIVWPDGATSPTYRSWSNGDFLRSGYNRDFGPQRLFTVEPDIPVGTYEFNCVGLDPVTGETFSLDRNSFEVQ